MGIFLHSLNPIIILQIDFFGIIYYPVQKFPIF